MRINLPVKVIFPFGLIILIGTGSVISCSGSKQNIIPTKIGSSIVNQPEQLPVVAQKQNTEPKTIKSAKGDDLLFALEGKKWEEVSKNWPIHSTNDEEFLRNYSSTWNNKTNEINQINANIATIIDENIKNDERERQIGPIKKKCLIEANAKFDNLIAAKTNEVNKYLTSVDSQWWILGDTMEYDPGKSSFTFEVQKYTNNFFDFKRIGDNDINRVADSKYAHSSPIVFLKIDNGVIADKILQKSKEGNSNFVIAVQGSFKNTIIKRVAVIEWKTRDVWFDSNDLAEPLGKNFLLYGTNMVIKGQLGGADGE